MQMGKVPRVCWGCCTSMETFFPVPEQWLGCGCLPRGFSSRQACQLGFRQRKVLKIYVCNFSLLSWGKVSGAGSLLFLPFLLVDGSHWTDLGRHLLKMEELCQPGSLNAWAKESLLLQREWYQPLHCICYSSCWFPNTGLLFFPNLSPNICWMLTMC